MKVYQGQIILAVISEQREEIYLLMKILHFAFSILHLNNFYLLSAFVLWLLLCKMQNAECKMQNGGSFSTSRKAFWMIKCG